MLSRLATIAVFLSVLVAMAATGCAAPTLSSLSPTGARAAAVSRRVHLPVPKRFQGDTMSCGPSALWSVMSHLLGPGKVNFANLDKSLRPTGNLTGYIGTMPGGLARAPERYHLVASVHNEGSTADLRRLLDAGLPVIILGVNDEGDGSGGLHYIVVNGYEGSNAADTTWILTDSMVEDGKEHRWNTKRLMAFWDDLKLVGRRLPYQRAMVTVAPKGQADQLPEDNRSAWLKFVDSTVKTVFELLKWLDAGRNGEAPAGWAPPKA
jgi:hypothetical protein